MLSHASKNIKNSQVKSRLHFWFLRIYFGFESDWKGALAQNLWGKKDQKALNRCVFLDADKVGMPDRGEQSAQGVLGLIPSSPAFAPTAGCSTK
jgi:hypothetical protein